MIISSLLLASLLAFAAQNANAHSRLLTPPARGAAEHWGDFTDYRTPACGDYNQARSSIQPTATYQRGQRVPVVWPRNNHPGGFIKLAIIPLNRDKEEQQADFDAAVVQYSCHESTCKSGDPNDPLGGDANGVPVDGNPCSTTLTVPSYLQDGEHTMQWMWFAGGSYFGDVNRGQTSYYGCHDFTLAGGAAVTPKADTCPSFIPGDAHNPASKGVCKYFGSGEPLGCKPDGCPGKYLDGMPPPLARCLASHPAGSAPPAPTASPTASAPSTSAAPTATDSPAPAATTDSPAPTTTTDAPKPTATRTQAPAQPTRRPRRRPSRRSAKRH